jgi:nucleoside-diphosphate-sugar epimerase
MTANWANRSILITGATGFLGQHLTRRLVELGARVTVALCEEDGPAQTAALPPAVDRRDGDVRNYGQMRRLVEATAPQVLFHLAAVGVNDPFIGEEMALGVNLHGTLNTLRAVRRSGIQIQRVIVAGTSYEYGPSGELDPGNVYAASKVAAWAFCRMYYRAHGVPVVVARPFNVYGPGQNHRALIPSAIRAALSGQDFPMTPGEQRRDFIYVKDVIEGFLALAKAAGVEGHSLDLGTGHATSVREAVEQVFSLCGSTSRPQAGALPYRPGVVWELAADARCTQELTGWAAQTELEEGLQRTINAFTATSHASRLALDV